MSSLLHDLNETEGGDEAYKVRERVKFHCPNPSHRSKSLVIERCKAYEKKANEVLQPLADALDVHTRSGFWTRNELRTALLIALKSNMRPDARRLMDAYDVMLRELNEGIMSDPTLIQELIRATDHRAFIQRLRASHQPTSSDPIFESCMSRIERGERNAFDLEYVLKRRTNPPPHTSAE